MPITIPTNPRPTVCWSAWPAVAISGVEFDEWIYGQAIQNKKDGSYSDKVSLVHANAESFVDEIDCADLFPGKDARERILIFEIGA